MLYINYKIYLGDINEENSNIFVINKFYISNG